KPTAEPDAFKALSTQIYLDATGNGEVPAGPTITNSWYVDYVYENVLGRSPDESGNAYWTNQLDTGAIVRSEFMALIIDAAAGDERDGAYIQNRTNVAVEFSSWENSNPELLDTLL